MPAVVTLSQRRYEKDPELTVNRHQCPETRRSLANYINKAKITLFVFLCSCAAAQKQQLVWSSWSWRAVRFSLRREITWTSTWPWTTRRVFVLFPLKSDSACFDGDQQHFCVVHWQFSINKHMCGTAWWSLCDIWPNRTMWWSSQRSAGWTVRAAVHAWLRCAPRRIWRVTSWRLKPRRPRSRCATDRGVKKRARRRRREPSDVLWFCLSIRVKASSAERSLAKPSVFCSLLFLNTFKSKQLKWRFDSCVWALSS